MSGVIYNYLTWMMNNRLFITVVSLLFCLSLAAQGGRWTEERAWAWYRQLPWLCGVNYIPANAINYTAMWDKTSFSPTTIDKELQLMENLGMNCVRVVLQHAVYADDAKYFLRTFDKFLDICSRHGIRVMPIFFDDCCQFILHVSLKILGATCNCSSDFIKFSCDIDSIFPLPSCVEQSSAGKLTFFDHSREIPSMPAIL